MRRSTVLVFYADAVGLTQASGEFFAVLTQLGEHAFRLNVQGTARYAL
jgi:hypothetical protein